MLRLELTTRRICLFVFLLALVLDLGQGIVRYRHVLGLTGQQFIDIQQFDARVHVTLAQRILNGQGYTIPLSIGRPEEVQPAFIKAPGYPYLLAALFWLTGISFSFFPLQCLAGAVLGVLVVLVSMQVFGDPLAALIAGLSAALNPILINSASQLYNENIYFCLFFLALLLYLRWWQAPSFQGALLCGIIAGFDALVRELVIPSFLALIVLVVIRVWRRSKRSALLYAVSLTAGLLIAILPWTIRNYVVTGAIVPISAISGFAVGAGNNSCVAAGKWTTAFYGDDPCPSLDEQRYALLAAWNREPRVVLNDRAYMILGLAYVREHPGEYLKLCVRRAWTFFDPWHPRQDLHGRKKLAMALYFLIFLAPGVIGAVWFFLHGARDMASPLYVLILAGYLPLALIFIPHDHRFSIGVHLILGMFAGVWMAHIFGRRAVPKP
ncbi:MAG TPA: glycosyltransferase family 39 protein [Bryobacteraceae bacterium]|nr:glycosyltransferase family 39 protein [Bryobacteraceae bacterium]